MGGQKGILRSIRGWRRRARGRRVGLVRDACAEEIGRVGHLNGRKGRDFGKVERGCLGSHDEAKVAGRMGCLERGGGREHRLSRGARKERIARVAARLSPVATSAEPS